VTPQRYPRFRQVVLDATDVRALAEFYKELLGYDYRPGDEQPQPGEDWLVLVDPSSGRRIAFQLVDHLPSATWPDTDVPQQLHLDLTVSDVNELADQHARALAHGARLIQDRSDDPEEPLRVYADPAGHPFCLFVSPDAG
jgi:catechol 2,3-dioxygenase-like lactoylglutathione lyase family enzyme